jgi:hypothetical protein
MADMHDWFFRMLLNGTSDRGVLKWWLNALEVSGTSSPVSIATGAAIIYGLFYESDTATTVSIPTPSSGFSRYDRIVIRRDWSVQTARIARIAGVAAASPAVPSMTQTAGAIYDIPLATVLVDDTGVITVTDTRDYCQFTTAWPTNTVDTDNYVAGAVTIAKVPDRTRWELKDAGQMEPDSTNAPTWTAGGSYDYWSFADAVTDSVWVYFMAPTGLVSSQVDIYVWSVPHVNGAGGGVENCQWDYNTYAGTSGGTLANTNGTVNVDQQARVNTTVYRDALISAFGINAGDLIIIKLDRDGLADSYNSAMRLLGVEMSWTADA